MLCELLVHEATHQYFHILTKLGPVDDGSDTALYYSPARQQERPLDFILLAYHAVGNMLLFHRQGLRANRASAAYRDQRIALFEDWAARLVAPLRGNGALTAVGHALWTPLDERIAMGAPPGWSAA